MRVRGWRGLRTGPRGDPWCWHRQRMISDRIRAVIVGPPRRQCVYICLGLSDDSGLHHHVIDIRSVKAVGATRNAHKLAMYRLSVTSKINRMGSSYIRPLALCLNLECAAVRLRCDRAPCCPSAAQSSSLRHRRDHPYLLPSHCTVSVGWKGSVGRSVGIGCPHRAHMRQAGVALTRAIRCARSSQASPPAVCYAEYRTHPMRRASS